jgi:hypothetical protein
MRAQTTEMICKTSNRIDEQHILFPPCSGRRDHWLTIYLSVLHGSTKKKLLKICGNITREPLLVATDFFWRFTEIYFQGI